MAGDLYCKCCSYIHYILPSNSIQTVGVAAVTVGSAATIFMRDQIPLKQIPYVKQVPLEHIPYVKQVPLQHIPHAEQVPLQQIPHVEEK